MTSINMSHNCIYYKKNHDLIVSVDIMSFICILCTVKFCYDFGHTLV